MSQIQLAVAVAVVRGGKVLLGRRSDSVELCPGTWAFPGGRVEFGETLRGACHRELREETGLELAGLWLWAVTEYVAGGVHLVCPVYAGRGFGAPAAREPSKCLEWGWYDWGSPPRPLMRPVEDLWHSRLPPPCTI